MLKRRKIECSNCFSILNESNISFLLQCGHPLCQSCSSKIGTELNCLSCGNKVSASDSPPTYLLADPMMADHEVQAGCVICEESHPASKYCLDCNQAHCESAANFHLRFLVSSKHQIVSIEEFFQYQKVHPHLSSLHPKSCNQHNRPFEFLDLTTQTRNELLCSGCFNGKHTSLAGLGDCASSSSSSSLLLQKLDHIRELDSERTARLAKMREEEEKLHSRLKGLEESRARSLSEIRRVFGSLHEALQTRQLELESEVEELAKSAVFSLSEEVDRNVVWQGQLSMLGKCVEELNSISSSFTSAVPPLISSSENSNPDVLSPRALMVDVCLLENALCSSLSSSASSSLLSSIRDQLHFSYRLLPLPSVLTTPRSAILSTSTSTSSTSTSSSLSPVSLPSSPSITLPSGQVDEEKTILHHISSMFYIASTSSLSLQSDWPKNNVRSVMTFYSTGNGIDQLCNPHGLTYSPDSKLFYVCDFANNRIQVFRNHPHAECEGRLEIEYLPSLGNSEPGSSISSSRSSSGLALDPPYTAPPFAPRPMAICYHDGQFFIVDHDHHCVQVWRAEDGSFLRMIGTGIAGKVVGQFNYPYDCTVYGKHLYVADFNNHRVQKFSLSDWSVVKVIGSKGSGLGQLNHPTNLTVFNDKLYVSDWRNNRISVFDPESGSGLRVIGPSLSNDEELFEPCGLLFSHNLLFVCSEDCISVFDSNHNYLYSFGSEDSEEGQFSQLVMVDGRLFVCSGNDRIQVFEQKLDY